MERIAVDTSAMIEFLKGNEHIAAVLLRLYESDADIVLPTIVRYELLVGIRDKRGEVIVKSFRTIDFNDWAADIAARVQKVLKRKGKTASAADLLIAATCLAHGAKLLTLDKGFERFKEFGLQIVSS